MNPGRPNYPQLPNSNQQNIPSSMGSNQQFTAQEILNNPALFSAYLAAYSQINSGHNQQYTNSNTPITYEQMMQSVSIQNQLPFRSNSQTPQLYPNPFYNNSALQPNQAAGSVQSMPTSYLNSAQYRQKPAASPVTSSPSIPEKSEQDLEYARGIKRKIEDALAKDLKALSEPKYEPFKNKREVIDALLPFHIYQLPNYSLDEDVTFQVDEENIFKEATLLLQRGERVLAENQMVQLKLI
jgi:hypothetical protein